MSDQKNSFIFYRSFYEAISDLDDAMQLTIYKAIIEYGLNKTEPILNNIEMAFFILIKHQLDGKIKSIDAGDKHWNWKGGISSENNVIRQSKKTKIWRKAVFERDNYICQHCSQVGGDLQAHHIRSFAKFPELRFVINNGLTLCKKCHNAEHSERQV